LYQEFLPIFSAPAVFHPPLLSVINQFKYFNPLWPTKFFLANLLRTPPFFIRNFSPECSLAAAQTDEIENKMKKKWDGDCVMSRRVYLTALAAY
jgi:hypothetical protein